MPAVVIGTRFPICMSCTGVSIVVIIAGIVIAVVVITGDRNDPGEIPCVYVNDCCA
jgi:hypothetical protein